MTLDVRKALEAARDAAAAIWPAFDVRFADECTRDDGEVAQCDAFAAAIAAFLLAFPAGHELTWWDPIRGALRVVPCDGLHQLAAAVEQAAKEPG